MEEIILKFNEKQLQAINHYEKPCAVISSAGSGKSTVLLHRVKNLIEKYNVPEREILVITFTRNTGNELKDKLFKMGYSDVNVGTFHSVCRRILFNGGYDVSDTKMIKEWEVENLFKGIDKDVDIKDVSSFISYQKNYNKTYNDEFVHKDSAYSEEDLRMYFKAYEDYKKDKGLYDFDDFLIECYKILKDNPKKYSYDFLLVDEHQDSNLLQNMLIKEWVRDNNIFCLFDYRQCIYKFRGSNPEYSMNFDKDWKDATIINMEVNYRSARNIVENSNNFIKKYYGDYEHYKDAVAYDKDNGFIDINTYYSNEEESIGVVDEIERLINIEKVEPNEIAVLYRANSQSSYIENELIKRGIEYEITNDSSFFKRKEINGIMAYLRLINNPHDDNAFETIFKLRNYPIAFFSNSLLSNAKKFAGLNNLSLYEAFITMNYPNQWQTNNVNEFHKNVSRLRMQNDKNIGLIELINNIIKVFKLEDYIHDKYSNEEEINERLESLDTLKSFVKNNTIDSFINYVYSSNNKNKRNKGKCVKLMSIHASKGLEFDNVFLIGVEDGKFPHEKSEVLEEARLFYVAVTRAKKNLYISEIGSGNRFIDEYLN